MADGGRVSNSDNAFCTMEGEAGIDAAKLATPLIDSILDGMNAGTSRIASSFSEAILRETHSLYGNVGFDRKICTELVSGLLKHRMKSDLKVEVLRAVASWVTKSLMSHAPTRDRIESLWRSVGETNG